MFILCSKLFYFCFKLCYLASKLYICFFRYVHQALSLSALFLLLLFYQHFSWKSMLSFFAFFLDFFFFCFCHSAFTFFALVFFVCVFVFLPNSIKSLCFFELRHEEVAPMLISAEAFAMLYELEVMLSNHTCHDFLRDTHWLSIYFDYISEEILWQFTDFPEHCFKLHVFLKLFV